MHRMQFSSLFHYWELKKKKKSTQFFTYFFLFQLLYIIENSRRESVLKVGGRAVPYTVDDWKRFKRVKTKKLWLLQPKIH